MLAKLVQPKKFEFFELEIPQLKENEVLIEVLACGICSSELPVFDGSVIGTPGVSFRYEKFPADLGHEIVGNVVDKGSSVERFNIGDCVTGLTYSGCGFSTYFVESEDVLIKVNKKNLENVTSALGEPLMATVNIIRQAEINCGDTVAVVGDGFMALLLIAGLGSYPLKELIVVGHHSNRLALASKFGATKCINAKQEDAWEIIMQTSLNQGVDISVEYAGNSDALRLAASICKPKQRAKLVMASAYSNDMPFTIGNYLQNRAPILVPAYPNHSSNKMLDLERGLWGLEKNIFPMTELITHRYNLKNINNAFEMCIARKDRYIKGIIIPND
ncbi:MAG: zinc-dependent alcohol dehydrogenase [Candidatus Anammoxibacter sp.]